MVKQEPIPEYPKEIKRLDIKIDADKLPKIMKAGDYLYKKNEQWYLHRNFEEVSEQ